jgi:hypothetical protein
MKGFDDATPRAKSKRMNDFADMVEWPEGDYKSYRMIGPIYSVCNIWFNIATQRKPEGQAIPKQCLDHDGETDKMTSDACPFRNSGKGRESKSYYVNVIDREEQEGRKYKPITDRKREKHLDHVAYWGKAGDSRKTPVRLLEIPDSQIDKLVGFKKLNKVKKKDGTAVAMDISDSRFGCDINLLFDPSKKGPARYDVQKGDRTPITEEEEGYLLYRPDMLKPMSLEAAKREMSDLNTKIVEKDKPKVAGKTGKGRREDADDPMMDDDTVSMKEDDLEDDDDLPRKNKKRSRDLDEDDMPRSKKSKRDDMEDLDSDFDDAPKKKKRNRDEDEDDDLLDDLPKKKKRNHDDEDLDDLPKKPKKRVVDEDEDEEPVRKKKKRPVDEDEDEPPRRKRRSRDEDDEDEDD